MNLYRELIEGFSDNTRIYVAKAAILNEGYVSLIDGKTKDWFFVDLIYQKYSFSLLSIELYESEITIYDLSTTFEDYIEKELKDHIQYLKELDTYKNIKFLARTESIYINDIL